jgi:ribosomal protection tetracycline resistance protein
LRRIHLEVPTGAAGAVLTALARLGVVVESQSSRDSLSTIDATLPAARVQALQRRLAGLTGGEGVLESVFGGYQPVNGIAAKRASSHRW